MLMGPASCCESNQRRVGVAGEAFSPGLSAGLSSSERLHVSHQLLKNCGLFKKRAVKVHFGELKSERSVCLFTLLRRLSSACPRFDWTFASHVSLGLIRLTQLFCVFVGLNLLTGSGPLREETGPESII